ncbi:hypothetical protein DHEL01_v213021, partial [Diaporthe helianthi]
RFFRHRPGLNHIHTSSNQELECFHPRRPTSNLHIPRRVDHVPADRRLRLGPAGLRLPGRLLALLPSHVQIIPGHGSQCLSILDSSSSGSDHHFGTYL